MADMMMFPNTVEEFMEQYKITDTEQIYTNGADLVPIFRMKQWFEHAADVQPVVRCKDCVYWQKPQIRLDDGTYRDYLPGECESGLFGLGVTSDVGINIGSFCAMYNTDHQNRIPQFMEPDDFCSKGYRAMDGGDT